MKNLKIACVFLGLWFLGPLLFGLNAPVILPTDDPESGRPLRVVWPTEPGMRYELQQSVDLKAWTVVSGYPSEAEALAQQHAFAMEGDRRFFRVIELDEQAPEIVRLTPSDKAFGVSRFSAVSILLEDRTGIDPATIALSIGGGAPLSASHAALSYADGVLTYDLAGDVALGAYGELIEFALSVADPLGNAATYTWSFELEREIEVVEGLFVFGSPNAQRAGQRLSGPAATVAARFGGPVRASSTSVDWELDSVTADAVLIAYTSTNAPVFTVGQKITNLAPANVAHIFYREVTSVAVDSVAKTVTLGTVDLNLPDVMPEGSFTMGDNAVFLEFDEAGNLAAMRSFTVTLPSIGADFSGETVYAAGPLAVTLPEARALFHPTVTLSLETKWGKVERFAAKAEGDFDLAVAPQLSISGSYDDSVSRELWRDGFWVWTTVGIVPVGVEVTASVTANASIKVGAQATFRTGFRQTASMGLEGVYLRDSTPPVTWDRWFTLHPMQLEPFTYTLSGNGSATISLVPQIDVRLYGAVGLYLNTDPRLELSGSASMTDGVVTEASWLLGAYADVNAGLSVVGFENDELPALPPFRFFTREWGQSYAADPTPGLGIIRQPQSENAQVGDSVVFAVEASGSGNLSYQWHHNGNLLPGETGRELRLSRITSGFVGDYFVRVRDANGMLDSSTANLNIVSAGSTGPAPTGFVLIPAGTFTMGDSHSGGPGVEHEVTLSAFYMARHETTKAHWDAVREWASTRGYTDLPTGGGKGANHPVHAVNWHDVVKWCNAASERDGLAPVYRTSDGEVYRADSITPTIQYANNGYRLPTESEREYAARGGQTGKRFPWGDTVTHVNANYTSSSNYDYDVSTTRASHPSYNDGTTPYTSPVGSFAANGYGLYDMTGNVWEWCNDWSGSYTTTAKTNPSGPATGSVRVDRGGGWRSHATSCRTAFRGSIPPDNRNDNLGFRLTRNL